MTRYALYFSPPQGAFAETAAHWLGRDALSGTTVVQPDPALWAVTQSARRYGFHATLKAPFRLAPSVGRDDLIAAVTGFASSCEPLILDGLHLAVLQGFLALVPRGQTTALDAFAARVVTSLDHLRAPMTEADRARRNPDALSTRQRALLDAYGYPYVLDEFRFHMTLTDRLTTDQQAVFQPLAERLFTPVLPQPFIIDDLAVFVEGPDGLFHQCHRVSLG